MVNPSKKNPRSRTVITPSGGIVRGKFPSRKAARMVHHEGLLELGACLFFELSPRVISYQEQPPKIQYADNNRLRVYTPDFELLLDDGNTVLVEVKPKAILDRPEIRQKYDLITSHMQRDDQPFSILTDKCIRREPRLSNLHLAYRALAAHSPSQARLESILPQLIALQNPSIHLVNSILRPHKISAFDLLAGGYMTCDLTQPLNSSTLVSISEEREHDWVQLSKELSL
ncbi:MAG: TnsA endonuclease N-terminal domain-containing protein [Castellaniella sp.]|uniref:TnsA endonuclease N-terminal domain-containing protein n=1 Tax=Castellaniella sp. TaxID=1955812 RepID=UPI002A37033F|nr:TnsA endonuclease N-terminal domain-containing protein [Castellaniella sp.]MDY0309789.1 TnsA endonuclease N-terminal domain-containing protein [Castellaniella sp.]